MFKCTEVHFSNLCEDSLFKYELEQQEGLAWKKDF